MMISSEYAELTKHLSRPLSVGGKTVANRLWLAPMAGLTHVAFRRVLAQYGFCGLSFTEMCSAKAVPTENRRVSPVFRWHTSELDSLVCQVAGPTPQEMAIAARRVEDEGFWGVDINMGCSARGMLQREAGAYLLKKPETALAIVEAVRREVSIPVLVKFRSGWSKDIAPAVALARQFESAGVDALVFHPRIAPDKRTRPPIRDHIRSIKEAVSIPVFGNGDVVTPMQCLDMMKATGCDGVSVGRMAVARPWIFAEWTGNYTPEPNPFQAYVLRVVDALEQEFDPIRAMKRFRLFMPFLAANFTFGHRLQADFSIGRTMDEVREIALKRIHPEMSLVQVPNTNLYSL